MSALDPAAAARLRRLGGERLLRELIELFLQLGPARVDAGTAAASDWEAAERACHSLKSAAGNLGAVELQRLAGEQEDAAAARRTEGWAERGAALRAAYAAAERELRELLQGMER